MIGQHVAAEHCHLKSLEHHLLAKAREGDAAAFQSLLAPLIPSLRRLAYAFAGNWDEADDLAQEALVKAFRGLDAFEERSSLSTWLYAITRSVCRDWYRARGAKRRDAEPLADDSAVSAAGLQDELIEQRELRLELWDAIQTLDPEFRAVVVLFDIEGLSYTEIAEIEAVPLGTVRSRLNRARQRLRTHLLEVHPSIQPRGRVAERRSSPGSER